MGDSHDAGEGRVQVRAPVLPLVRRVVLLMGALLYANTREMPTHAIRNIVDCLVGTRAHDAGRVWYLLVNAHALATHLLAVLAAGGVALWLARAAHLRRTVPGGLVPVRTDAAGLHAGEQLIMTRADMAGAEVTTDPDEGFTVVVRSRAGATARVHLRDEADAQALASALDPASVPGRLVFEGVGDVRARETALAGAAVAGVVVAALAYGSQDPLGFWRWVDRVSGRQFWWAHPETPLFWTVFAVEIVGMWAVLALAALAARPVVQRLRTARVTVDPEGVTLGEGATARRIARDDLARVEAGDTREVTLALRTGRAVRLRFSADRPVVDRDAFAARVRTIMMQQPVATYPAAETSGVRVALRQEEAPADEEPDAIEQPTRARRR